MIAIWSSILAAITLALLISINLTHQTEIILTTGLFIFGAVFALNSSLHSYLILSIAQEDNVSMDVGFYYTANALGRLLGTMLSGFLYQSFISSEHGLLACLLASFFLATVSAFLIKRV